MLSYSGYPSHVYEPMIRLFRERPPAMVVVIHDADWDGCRLAGAIADDPRWFAGVELPKVVDAGLRPGDAPRYRGLFQLATRSFDIDSSLITPAEAKWLGKFRLELAAARPRVLMGVLARVLRGEGEAEAGSADDGGLWLAPGAWADGDDDVG